MNGMKEQIRVWDDEIQKILDKTRLSSEDRETITGIFREVAYQWCNTNAVSRAFEREVVSAFPDVYAVCVKPGLLEEKIREELEQTYPFVEEDELFDGAEILVRPKEEQEGER